MGRKRRPTRHEIREVTVSLSEDHVSMLRDSLLELLLKVSATVLILAERKNFSLKILDPSSSESVDWS